MPDIQLHTTEPTGDCAVLRVAGEVDLYSAPLMREGVLDLVARGAVHIMVDLSNVTFLDSTGLGALVGCLRRVRLRDGSLTLVISAERILRIFQITGLTKVFPPHPSASHAITHDPHWRHTVEAEAGSVESWCRQQGLS